MNDYFVRDRAGLFLAQAKSASRGVQCGLHRIWQVERENALLVSEPGRFIAGEFNSAEVELLGIHAELRSDVAPVA